MPIKKQYILIILFIFFNCVKNNKYSIENKNIYELEWFSDENNYQNIKKYHEKFKKEYSKCIIQQKYEKAKILLYNFNSLIYDRFASDSLSLETTKKYIKQNYPVKKDSTFVMLHLFVTDQYSNLNNYKECLKYAFKTIELNKTTKNITINNKINNLLGILYVSINKPEKALKHLTSVLKINEDTKNYSGLGVLYYNIGDAYSMLNAYDESEKFYSKAALNFKKAKDTSYYFALKSNLIVNRFERYNDTVNTIKSINIFFQEFKKYKNPSELDNCYFYEINYLKNLLKHDYDSCFIYNNKVLKYYEKSRNNFMLTNYKICEIEIYFSKYKKLKNEAEVIKMAEFFVSENNIYESLSLYNILYKNAKLDNDYDKALKYLEKKIELNELIIQKNQKGQLFEFEKKYESQNKEKKIAQQEITLSQNKLLISTLINVLVIVFLIIIIYYIINKKNKVQNKSKIQEQFTSQLIQNTEDERSRIAGELHDSVNHELLNIKNNIINGKKIVVEDISNVIEEIRNISRNLHPAVLDTLGFEAGIEYICERATEIGLFTTCEINYSKSLNKNKELQLYRIIQEALNNTLKHGKANAAKVILNSDSNYLYLEIKDNGNGFNVKNQLNNPKSFGIQSILQRAKAIAAKININSTSKGTIILLKIPI